MTEEYQLIHSPLEQTHSADGHILRIFIYRSPDSDWTLEVEDELGTSSVWDGLFDTDSAALEAALDAIESEGVLSFVSDARPDVQTGEPERSGLQLEGQQPVGGVPGMQDMMAPLSAEELDELDRFMLDVDSDESMTLEMFDGFLHGIVIGPETVMPSTWLPLVWGEETGAMMPRADDVDQINHNLGLVMRYYNGIVWGFEQRPPVLCPLGGTHEFSSRGVVDAEAWAYGFNEAVKLTQSAWQPLFDDPAGWQAYWPIGLLGAEDFSPDQDELTRTPEQRHALAQQIHNSLLLIHAFWLPLRQRRAERQAAQRTSHKVGRNEACPCGSGKKFKKCCGGASRLH